MPDSLVLCYHAVSDEWPCSLAVPGELLRKQLEHLVSRGYRGATLTEIARGEAPDRALAVTFDDGYRSVVQRALPLLSELGLPGTTFVPTDFVGRDEPMSWPGIDHWIETPHRDELCCMDWGELGRLLEAGWEVGSHTRSHPHLPRIADRALADELSESREECARELGSPCTSLAYPYGDYDRRVKEAAAQAGYTVAASLRPGKERPYSWPRVGVYPVDRLRRFRIKTSRAVRLGRASLPGQAAEGALRWRPGTRG